jgi:uncharacterized DUF497 family protein
MRDDEFEWDDRKAKRNDREHGVTFEIARFVFDDPNAIDRLDLDRGVEGPRVFSIRKSGLDSWLNGSCPNA